MTGRTKAERLAVLPDDIDPSLPALRPALSPEAVAARFAAAWPGDGPAPTIAGCGLLHLRWTPGVSAEASYELLFAPPAPAPGFTIGVVTVRPDGVRHRLFVDDAALPGLAGAADAAVVGPWLAEQSGRRSPPCAVVPVRYRAGRRCVLRYEWADHPPLYGKVLASAPVEPLATVLSSLGDELVAPMVGAAPRWQLLVQHDVGVARGTGEARDPYRTCGEVLGLLHAASAPPGAPCTLLDDVDALGEHLAVVQRLSGSGPTFAAGMELLAETTGADLGPTVPSHGAYRVDQVLAGADGPRLVDLDSYCQAVPARDLGNFLAYLRWRSIRKPGFALAETADAFMDGYRRTAPGAVDGAHIARYEGASLLKIAGRRFRRLAVTEWPLVPDLLAAAHDRIGAGPP